MSRGAGAGPVRRDTARAETGLLRRLIGSGHKVALVALPAAIVAPAANVAAPSFFRVGGPPTGVRVAAAGVLAVGVGVWAWSVVLILDHVPRGELITTGPYAVVKHPLYTGVALLVLPAAGVLMDSWAGAVIGAALYAGSRMFGPEEEAELADRFGERWERYRRQVWLPWL